MSPPTRRIPGGTPGFDQSDFHIANAREATSPRHQALDLRTPHDAVPTYLTSRDRVLGHRPWAHTFASGWKLRRAAHVLLDLAGLDPEAAHRAIEDAFDERAA